MDSDVGGDIADVDGAEDNKQHAVYYGASVKCGMAAAALRAMLVSTYEFKAYFCALEHAWCTAPDNSKNR